jgi:hypothetical protein
MDRLSPVSLDTILRYARRGGMLVFIDTDGKLKAYPKTSKVFRNVGHMTAGIEPQMKMHIIRTTLGEDNECQSSSN